MATTKRPSTYVTTTVPFKPTPVRPVTAIKPVKPFVWKTPAPKLPKADPTALSRLVKVGPAGIKARTDAKR
jgi:hypothetical protein